MRKKTKKKLKLILTGLFVLICFSSVFLVVLTLDENEEIDMRTVPHLIPFEKIIDGGPPKDGIPSINVPIFISIEEADPAMEDNDKVLIVNTSKDIKMYPLDILSWHQIVNDTVSDPPLLVTYCPLSNSVAAYQSVYQGQLLSFGVTGKLYESNMLMYDRQTNSLWQQFTGNAVLGEMTETSLPRVESFLMPWNYAKKKFPKALVLSRDTGFERNYDEVAYETYMASDKLFFDVSNKDARLPLKEIAYGVSINEKGKVYPESILDEQLIIQDTFEDTALVVVKNPQTGIVKFFKNNIYGEELKFKIKEDGIFDKLYGSKWNFDGECVEGKMKNWRLPELPSISSFWFTWSNFYPETEIYIVPEGPELPESDEPSM